jgi:hypothetical protein
MKRVALVFSISLVFFLLSPKNLWAGWAPSLTPVSFYTATRPSQPMAWYPDVDLECFFPPGCGNFFYAPNIIAETGKYKMWTTIDDMIFYFESTDGRTWTNGHKVMSAIQSNWENDANCRLINGSSLCGGLSNSVVVKGVTSGWTYTMYYTAGPTVNTNTNGGLGVAFSNDGINWTRYTGNPIRKFPGGGTFAANAMKIGDKFFIFFYGGGNYAQNDAPPLRVAADSGNGTKLGNDFVTFGNTQTSKTAYPIAYDAQAGSCWFYNRGVGSADWGSAGPIKFQIYKGSDCFFNLGTQVAEVTSALTGSTGNGIAGVGIKERDGNGQLLSGTSSLQLYFGAGEVWAAWQPKSVTISPSTSNSPIGVLHLLDCQTASGWALDEDNSAASIDIHFYYDAFDSQHFLGSTKADKSWPGICSYHSLSQPPCTDNHKYIFNIPSTIKDGKSHQIYAFGLNASGTGGTNAPLTGSPKTLTCQTSAGINISNLRQLLQNFTNIFDYNKIVGNYGK